MELFLKDGDYLPDGKGGFVRATGGEELLQRLLFQLTVRRGSFPLLPTLGSRLYELPRHKAGEWSTLARQYVGEALSNETDVTVTEVVVTPVGNGASVQVRLDYRGQALGVTLEV